MNNTTLKFTFLYGFTGFLELKSNFAICFVITNFVQNNKLR